MRTILAVGGACAILISANTAPVFAQSDRDTSVSISQTTIEIPISPLATDKEEADRRTRIILSRAYQDGFEGEIILSHPNNYSRFELSPALRRLGYGDRLEDGPIWPLASIAKQIVASITVSEAANDPEFDLDAKASRYISGFGTRYPIPTIRDLLQHRSGLANPEDTEPDDNGWPSAYSDGRLSPEWCIAKRQAPPTEGYSYNNCDYIVLRKILENVTFAPFEDLLTDHINTMPAVGDISVANADTIDDVVFMKEPERSVIPSYDAAGGLIGTLPAVWHFNFALMVTMQYDKGKRADLWKGDPALGHQALGQWVYEATPSGCEEPMRIVERRGAIGRYQTLNVLLPDNDMFLVAATAQPEQEFSFGSVMEPGSFLHDALATLACGTGA